MINVTKYMTENVTRQKVKPINIVGNLLKANQIENEGIVKQPSLKAQKVEDVKKIIVSKPKKVLENIRIDESQKKAIQGIAKAQKVKYNEAFRFLLQLGIGNFLDNKI
jgi:hypothetical protein